jgi:ABC-type phosphate transport system substrate-binding protein
MAMAGSDPAAAQATGSAPAFQVIVHPQNPTNSVDRKFLADVFLKKRTRWPHDEVVKPVDASSRSAVRGRFSQDVLKRSVAAVRRYWQQIVFSGRGVPPPELDSDEAIVSYVLKNRGAIGYVSGNAELGKAKVVQVK